MNASDLGRGAMVEKRKWVIVAGARPNFMKIAPFLRQVHLFNSQQSNQENRIEVQLIHTGQHYDYNMSAVFFRELGIPEPDINLGVGAGSHATQTAKIMIGFEAICSQSRLDWVVVVGDVNSTLACAIVCAKLGIRIAHIEAGLRSFDKTMPEEINRLVTDALADLLFTPSQDANENLFREGIERSRVKFVGNIMIDSLIGNLPLARSSSILTELGVERGCYIYVTLHRPSNVDRQDSLSAIMSGLENLAQEMPIVFPLHPRTNKVLSESGLRIRKETQVILTNPVGYHASLCLAENARLVLTDSGGLQEETTFFRTPCLTLRPNTERPITMTLGSNRLTRLDSLIQDVRDALRGPERLGQVPPLWDGRTSERVLAFLLEA